MRNHSAVSGVPLATARSRIRGSLLAGAVGDALGAPVEFMSLQDIRRQHGPAGVTGYLPAYGRPGGAITDDTQMTLFTAEGMIRALIRYSHRGTLAGRGRPTPEGLESLGAGWVGEEALAIAVCCALVADDVLDGLLLAVNHSGDTDSTGSITGNIPGAIHGEKAIPESFLPDLELRDVITTVADDLTDAFYGEGVGG